MQKALNTVSFPRIPVRLGTRVKLVFNQSLSDSPDGNIVWVSSPSVREIVGTGGALDLHTPTQ